MGMDSVRFIRVWCATTRDSDIVYYKHGNLGSDHNSIVYETILKLHFRVSVVQELDRSSWLVVPQNNIKCFYLDRREHQLIPPSYLGALDEWVELGT